MSRAQPAPASMRPLAPDCRDSLAYGAPAAAAPNPASDTASVEDAIKQSKALRHCVGALASASEAQPPNLAACASLLADVVKLEQRLTRLAKSSVTDVKIRAGGEEHRLRDAQDTLLLHARAQAAQISRAADTTPASRRPSLDPAPGCMAALDAHLSALRQAAFDDAASERKSLFWYTRPRITPAHLMPFSTAAASALAIFFP